MNEFTVDFIVVGAGSAGAALASRLTESGRFHVLLLEAGGETHPLSRVPISFAKFINRPGVNWLYASEPEANTGGRPIPVPRGNILGGSSAINGMVWNRGQRHDYDAWARWAAPAGRTRTCCRGSRRWRATKAATTTPRPCRPDDGDAGVDRRPPLDRFLAAGATVGLAPQPRLQRRDSARRGDGAEHVGRGRRISTAHCYLGPARMRANLTIDTGATAECLILEGKRCVGVRYTVDGETERPVRRTK